MFYRIAYAIVIPILRLLYRVRVTGREHVPEGAVLLCANHTALIDPIFAAMVTGWRRPLSFMAKEELFRVPIVRSFIRWVNAFPVARGQSDIKAVRQSVDVLKNGGRLLIFPDGRRVKARGESLPQLGAAMIASRAGVPILPVYISYPKHPFRRTSIVIKPIIAANPVNTNPPRETASEHSDGSGAAPRVSSSEYYRELTGKIEEAVWTCTST
jgi:1-acyl-sn-glycerol-3-phosphate acyltransferase